MRRLPSRRRPTHPGRVFLKAVLEPLGLTQREAAERLRISYPRMNEIVNGKRTVTPETALRLARFSGTEPEFWLDLQQAVDLWDALHADGVDDIDAIEPAMGPGDHEAGRSLVPGGPTSKRRAERYSVARVFPLGEEPAEDLRAETTALERLAMVEELTRQSWRLARARVMSPPGKSAPDTTAGDSGDAGEAP